MPLHSTVRWNELSKASQLRAIWSFCPGIVDETGVGHAYGPWQHVASHDNSAYSRVPRAGCARPDSIRFSAPLRFARLGMPEWYRVLFFAQKGVHYVNPVHNAGIYDIHRDYEWQVNATTSLSFGQNRVSNGVTRVRGSDIIILRPDRAYAFLTSSTRRLGDGVKLDMPTLVVITPMGYSLRTTRFPKTGYLIWVKRIQLPL